MMGRDRPWPTKEQHKPYTGPSRQERKLQQIMHDAVKVPRQEARRYEERYGPVEPYTTVEEYDRERMRCAEEDNSPDSTARHYARAERTPVCVRYGSCTLHDHEETCPRIDEQQGD